MSDLIAISNAAADAAGIPRLLLLACAVAESNMNPEARRPKNPADDERYWPDVSFGAWQQTVRWDAAYLDSRSKSGADPSKFPGAATVRFFGEQYYIPEFAAEVAAANLAQKLKQVMGL